MDENLLKKYDCIIIGNARFYKIDFTKELPSMDSTVIKYAELLNNTLESTSWNKLIIEFARLLFQKSKPKCDPFTYNPKWTMSKIFDSLKNEYNDEVFPGYYLNKNFSTTKLCLLINDLLEMFGVDKNEMVLYVKRRNNTEAGEILKSAWVEAVTDFRYFIKERYHYKEKNIDTIVENVKIIDKHLRLIKPLQCISFFLVDDRTDLGIIKSKLIEYLSKKRLMKKEQVDRFREQLDYITEFVTYRYPLKKDPKIDWENKTYISDQKTQDLFIEDPTEASEEDLESMFNYISNLEPGTIFNLDDILMELGYSFNSIKKDSIKESLDEYIKTKFVQVEMISESEYKKILVNNEYV